MNELKLIPLRDITVTPHNPRKIKPNDPKLAELAASIKANGLLQPVVCRPRPGNRYELLAGERRLLAHKSLGEEMILAIVRELDDQAAIEVTVLENLQREDLQPLEQAAGVKNLVSAGRSLADIAERIGKSVQWVARRARIAELIPEWRERFENPKSEYAKATIAHMEIVARYSAERQEELLKELNAWLFDDDLDRLIEHFDSKERRLATAAWRLTDAVLLPAAGACSACQKRSGVMPELFHETTDEKQLAKDDRCLDGQCWKSKERALIAIREEILREDHAELLKVQAGYGDSEKGVLHSYQYDTVKKGTPGAKPAMIVDGNKAGSLTWVKPHDYGRGPLHHNNGPKTLIEKVQALEARRWCETVKRFRDQLEAVPFEKLIGGAQVLYRLVATFGTGIQDTEEEATWPRFDASEKTPLGVDQRIWEFMKQTLFRMMAYNGSAASNFDPQGEQVETAERTARLIGYDLKALYAQVCTQKGFVEPVGWAAERKALHVKKPRKARGAQEPK